MSVLQPEPRTTLVIGIGASEFPGDPDKSNPQFARSAAEIHNYFCNPAGFALPPDNCLWLFDSADPPTSVYDRIEEFLDQGATRLESRQPRDIIVYYVGHGFFREDDRAYYLAARSLKKRAPEYSFRFRDLQRTIKQKTRHLRKFYIIDACFSAAASRDLMSVDAATGKLIAEAEQGSADDLPNAGTALLCAAASDDVAIAPQSQDYTMFTGALLDVLNAAPASTILTLEQLHGRCAALIVDRFHDKGVRPQIHKPRQELGDIARIPLFPGRKASANSSNKGRERDAFNRETFIDGDCLYALVVKGATIHADPEMTLEQEVERAWKTYPRQITAAVNYYRNGQRLPPIPAGRSDGGFVTAVLDFEKAFDSQEALCAAIYALCRCELAVFDITEFDAAALFLLGVRSVARRGVTLVSAGADYVIGGELPVPFNLQLLNLSAHSKAQLDRGEGAKPADLIGNKIHAGFRELADLPHYQDLPAYDSVRQLGVESGAYRPLGYTEKALLLCPFSKEYSNRNWKFYLGRDLALELSEHARRSGLSKDASSPRVERLLDVRTPRLVAQTLYNAIRLTDLCVIDWTKLRPNVVFEAGVRLAANPLGAVHIMEETDADQRPQHVEQLLRLFDPVIYRCERNGVPYGEMIGRFEESIQKYGQGKYCFVFEAVGTSIGQDSQGVGLPVVDELLRDANILSSDDQESSGVSPVLFHEVNKTLVRVAASAAAERRFAAWLYLTQRFAANEVALDRKLREQFLLLKFQVRRWARKAGRLDLMKSVKPFEQAVDAEAVTEIEYLLAFVKAAKEEAKDLRDEGDIPATIAVLQEAVALMEQSPLVAELHADGPAGEGVRRFATQLADCQGMLGGNFRRDGQFEQAQEAFERGRVYELSSRLGVESSYNLVNAITLPLESQPGTKAGDKARELVSAAEAIQRQVNASRRTDRWAWADLALCRLLLGQLDEAMRSYGRVRDLGGPETIHSVVTVLGRLHNTLQQSDPATAAHLHEAMKLLEG